MKTLENNLTKYAGQEVEYEELETEEVEVEEQEPQPQQIPAPTPGPNPLKPDTRPQKQKPVIRPIYSTDQYTRKIYA